MPRNKCIITKTIQPYNYQRKGKIVQVKESFPRRYHIKKGAKIKIVKKKESSKEQFTTDHIKISPNISNKAYLLSDIDKDGILNIDDKKPLKKSRFPVEEVQLSTPIIRVTNEYNMNKKKENDIIDDFRRVVAKQKDQSINEVKEDTQYRVKKPISTLNKAIDKGLPQVRDRIGLRYLGDNYKDLNNMNKTLQKEYKLIEEKDFYKKPREDGYKGIHLIVEDTKNDAIIEIQLNTDRIRRITEINHLLYKEKKQNTPEFIRLINMAENADNGDKQAKTYIDSLTDKEIEKLLITGVRK